ncbi:MAG: arginyltransferase [Castellaniella sp.]|uniref:arginyltransferase n=1 Tax=Castellaniella sp. TaxID=1955812 RepID=UPI0011F46D5F|nr:arginyltransferase [Castellaniella sp.]TAN29749.1 MAG: arginyltransferase [Castellaniella sp.]
MSKPSESIFRHLQFYTTASYPCSYLPGRMARSEVAAPAHLVDEAAYSRLIERGFRRSGLFTYRPSCGDCQACIPIRVDAQRFQRDRTQRKLWHHMQPRLTARCSPLHWDPEHFQLYQRYQHKRHPGAGMDQDDQEQYTQFLLTSRVRSEMAEFHDTDGVLRMVSIMDRVDTGVSAVYTFYDPDFHGSLGTYGILWQLDYCRTLDLPWLYLGYWIGESRKMAYKSRFRPHQILRGGVWMEPAYPPGNATAKSPAA